MTKVKPLLLLLTRTRRAWFPAWLAALTFANGAFVYSQEQIQIHEQFAPGYQFHVSTRVELSGSLTQAPDKDNRVPKPVTINGTSLIEYDERVLALDGEGQVNKTARIYRRIDFQRKVGDQPQQSTIRPEVRRLIVLRQKNMEVPFSPDGPLLWGEIDLVRTDVFTPALVGLFPDKAVRPLDRWKATAKAVQELTDLERIDEGEVECRLEEVTTLAGRRLARVAINGTVRGINEDGPNRQQLQGYYFFDLESHHLSYVYVKGISSLLDKNGQTLGSVEGRFVLTRQVNQNCPDLSPAVLERIVTEPNADNTRLLYDNSELGLRFLYSRRWRVAGLRGRQVALDETNGSGLLITREVPAPTAAQFQTEVRAWLRQQKAQVYREEPPRSVAGGTGSIDQFIEEVGLNGQRVVMVYGVIRQAGGSVTLTARLLPTDLPALRTEWESIAKTLTIAGPGGNEIKK